MLRCWSSLRYSFLRTLFLLADELRRQPLYRVQPTPPASQEREVARRGSLDYFMPAPSDKPIAALRRCGSMSRP